VVAPVGGEIVVNRDRLLIYELAPVAQHLLLDRPVHVYLPGPVREQLVWSGAGLPEQRLQVVPVIDREIRQVPGRVGLMQCHRVRGERRVRRRRWQVVLLQHARLVHQAHRADVLGHRVQLAALGDLAPHPGGELAFVLGVILRDVQQVVCLGELREMVKLDLGNIWPRARGERGGELGVERAARTVGGRRLDGDPGIFLLEIRDDALRVSGPRPPGERDLLM